MRSGRQATFLNGGKMSHSFQIGDRVRAAPMWKYSHADGTVIKITKEYVVVRWDEVNGEWHYTLEQSKKLQEIKDDECR